MKKNPKTPRPAAPSMAPPVALAGSLLHTRLTLVETDTPELLAELRADRRIGPLLVGQLSECLALVAPGKAKELAKLMLKAGHTPKMIE
ncbi:MAG: hypothetical protein ACKV2V_16155 [Blastocatellia bacterium]